MKNIDLSWRKMRTALAVVALGLCSTEVQAQVKERRVNLTGDWKFILGDARKFAQPGHDDSDWETVYAPASWDQEGFYHYHGYAWYRKKFKISFEATDNLYLELERIDDADEVFINGKKIGGMGGFPPEYFTAYNFSRIYKVPKDVLRNNAFNVIAIRVYDEGGVGGIIGKRLGIYHYENYSDNSLNLAGQWKFSLGDDPAWASPTLSDRNWENVIVPADWESQGFRDYDGFAWYRKTFVLPENYPVSEILLLVGKIDDLDEVFVNGQRVGGTGDIRRKRVDDGNHREQRTYALPDHLLKAGKANTIAVRVYDGLGAGGIYEGPVVLIPQAEYKDFWRSYRSNTYDVEYWWSYFFD